MQSINTAILSFGMSGKLFHTPFINAHPGFTFYAVWERSKNLAQEIYPGVKTYRTLEELLGDPTIELVIVNTPNYTHYDYTKKALEAGKHGVVEKPFTVTVAEGDALIALAKKQKKKRSHEHMSTKCHTTIGMSATNLEAQCGRYPMPLRHRSRRTASA